MNTPSEIEQLNPITERIIGCALEVHRHLGGGLLEATYESAMCMELELQRLAFARQPMFSVSYKGRVISQHRADLIVESAVIVELKSVDRFDPVFDAQLLTYLRCTGLRVGLLINFHTRLLKTGIRRFVL
jgi:GxxExxY protein